MKNEQELKSLIQDVLHEIIGQDQNIENTINAGATNGESNPVSADSIPDITEVVISKQLLVPEPIDQEGYFNLKEKTPARIGVWHSGARYKTETALRFKADHAAAQDAVFSYVAEEFLEKNNIPLVSTICVDKDEFVTRPDFGRQFSDEVKEEIKKKCGNSQVQIVIGDGLSSAAIEANMEDTLNAIKQGLDIHNVKIGNDIFVKHCRVRAMDVIGDLTDADVVCLLIGERPGLVTAESMSAYIAYNPTVGMPEANRTVVSNIHQGGTPPAEAGAHIADLIKKMLDHKASGLNLSKLNV